jgi:GTP cyclohydrolase I
MEKNKPFDEEKVKEATKMLLEGLGEDINRPGLVDTPKRVVKYWRELTEGAHYTNQEIADMFRKDFQVSFDPVVFKECKNVFSHCFSYNTRILTPQGNSKIISKFKVGDYVRTFNKETGKLEDKKVTYIYKHKTNKWRKIKIGNTITTVTEEHPYFNDNMELIEAKDLKPGDKVWGLRQSYINSVNRIDIKSFKRNYSLGYILGTLLSDGSIWRNTLKLQVKEEWFADKFKNAIEDCFGLEPVKEIHHSYGFKDNIDMYCVRITNSKICSILLEICNSKYKTKEFSIPTIVFDNYDIFKGFFEAYLDGDGSEYTSKSNSQKMNRISSSNKQFILDVARIFNRSYYEEKGEYCNMYSVSIPLCFNNRDTKKGYENKVKENFEKNLKNKQPTIIYEDLILKEVIFNEKLKDYNKDAYNLEIEDNHTYIANSIWVHNCEHHLALMYNGTVYVAYVPAYWNGKDATEGYRVIGLSKIPRIVDMCSKRLQLQEKLVADIAECISLATGSDQVYVEAILDHGCVSARGVKASGVTETAYMSPALRENLEARHEIQNKVIIARS